MKGKAKIKPEGPKCEANLDYGPESVIIRNNTTGIEVRTPPFPEMSYIRIVDSVTEEELVYWNKDEWQNDPNECCIGAILGACKAIFDGKKLGL